MYLCPVMLSLQHYTLATMNKQKHSLLIFHYFKKRINNLGTQAKQGSHLILLPSCGKAAAVPHTSQVETAEKERMVNKLTKTA